MEKAHILDILKVKFPKTFSEENSIKPLHNDEAKVKLNNFPFSRTKAYFTDGTQSDANKVFITQSLESGIIKPIKTDELVALSPVFPLQQKNNKIRIVTDLRKVNQHLRYTPRPIPLTASILPQISQKTIFTVVDIRKAYQQIPIKGDKLASITQFGSYKFTHLFYGLASAPYW